MDRLETSIALYYRGAAYEDAGDLEHARADFNRAIEIAESSIRSHPRSPDGYIYRAYSLYELGEYDRALADYDAAIAIDRRRPSPHGGRGNILFRRGDYAGAIAEFDQAQQLVVYGNGEDYSAERCESRAAASTEIDEARRACDHAIREFRYDSDSWVSRGFLNFMQGQIEASASDLEAALRRDSRNATALYGHGVTSIRLGRGEEGQADIDRARGMDGSAVDYYTNAGLRP